MKYTTVYSTTDKNEVSVLKNLFEDEKIDYKILENRRGQTKGLESRFQVLERDQTKARELVDQTGFPRFGGAQTSRTGRVKGNKWIFVFLAALILVLAAIMFIWFLNVGQ